MLEREVASDFNTMFNEYGLLAPINNARGGWPDRLIQLTNSRVVAAEIKSVQQLQNGKIRLAEFRADQAAWLAKWQRNDGMCFLFVGITNFFGNFVGYAIKTCDDWRNWIILPNALLTLQDFDIVESDTSLIQYWFKEYTEFSYA